jgi:N-methylhydantoinase A
VRTYLARSDQVDADALMRAESALRDEAIRALRRAGENGEPQLERAASLRYVGQNYELEVPIPPGDLDGSGWQQLLRRFEAEHDRQYGFALPGETVELVKLRATALSPDDPVECALSPASPVAPGERAIWFDAAGPLACGVVRRSSLVPGDELNGPLVIEEPDSTTLVHPGDTVRVDRSGVLVLSIGGAA